MSEIFYPIDVVVTCNDCGREMYWTATTSKAGINLSAAPCRCTVEPEDTEPEEKGE